MKNVKVEKFYVYGKGIKKFDTLKEAMLHFNSHETSNGYKALGVEFLGGEFGVGGCDFICEKNNELKFSQDYKSYNEKFDENLLDNLSDAYYWLLAKNN